MKSDNYINSINLNQDTNFPYLVLNVINDNSYPRNPGFHVMHWHADIQFIYVFEGVIEVVTLDKRFILHEKEGIFINKNVVHLVNKIEVCHYNSFIFPDYFLRFYIGSPADEIVSCIIGKESLPVVKITCSTENQPTLNALEKLASLENHKTELYPYEVLSTLSSLWLEFCHIVNISTSESNKKNSHSSNRMTIFLQYIESHFKEDISLEMLAKSANVSVSECLRCFKATLQTTPYRYLTEYRLFKASEMLKNTDKPITIIASDVGFSHVSHFGKLFREKTGLSPSKYRK